MSFGMIISDQNVKKKQIYVIWMQAVSMST